MLQFVALSMLGLHDGAWVGFGDGAGVGSVVVGAAVVGSDVAGAWDGAGVGSLVAGIEVGTLVVGSEVVGAAVAVQQVVAQDPIMGMYVQME